MTKGRKTDYEALVDAGMSAADATTVVLEANYGSPETKAAAQFKIDQARLSQGLKLHTLNLTLAHRVFVQHYRPANPARLTSLGIAI